MKKIYFPLLFFLLLLLVSCERKQENSLIQQKKTTISLAYSWGYGFKNVIEDFKNRVSNDFILETEENIGLNHKQKILIDVSSNIVPDVFCFWSYETNLKYLADKDFLLNIDEYFNTSTKIKRTDFYEESLEATLIDGVNYGIPHERFFGFFAVNKSILDEYNIAIPKTWDDLIDMGKILNPKGIVPLSMGSFRGDPGHLFFSALTYQNVNGFSDTEKMKNTNNFIYPGTINAAEAVVTLINNNVVPNNTIYEGSYDRQVDIYNKREAAAIFAFSWSLALFDYDIAQNTLFIPVPLISNESVNTNEFTIGGTAQSICISKKAWSDPEKREAIITLVDWLLSDEVFNIRMEQSGCYPTKIMELPQMVNPIFEKATNYLNRTKLLGIHEFYFNSLNSFNQYKEANDLLWSGAIGRDDFLQMVQNSMEGGD
ncbi:MAG: extracellular solute-binding protein [Spirochaetales bacterium]|nr:extracellular solute-binding protein [Spirochaetales bacterium]